MFAQGRGAAGVTREGPDVSGDIVYLLAVPERERKCKEGRRKHHHAKPAERASESGRGMAS